jgi:hypothetical protein
MSPNTYTTLDGEVLDLAGLTGGERRFLNAVHRIYRERGDWLALTELVNGPDNPVIGPGRRVTREVANHPLYKAVRDLEDRLGILTGNLAPEPGDHPEQDPFDDALVSVAAAAAEKGTTTVAVRKAIERGDLVATKARPLKVSQRSLALWVVDSVRQRARAGT